MKRRSFLRLVALAGAVTPGAASGQTPGVPQPSPVPAETPVGAGPTGLTPGIEALNGAIPALVRHGGAVDPVDAFVSLPPRC